MTNPKLIYKAEKPYTEDLNDLVEADIQKGGVGSGQKGHNTSKPVEMNYDQKTEHYKKLIGHEMNSGRMNGKEHKRLSIELQNHQAQRNSMHSGDPKEKVSKVEKGGPGSGSKGHTTPGGTITTSSYKDGKLVSSESKIYHKPVGPGLQHSIGSSTHKPTHAELDPKKLAEAEEHHKKMKKLLGGD